MSFIKINGAREHNLKNIDIIIPRNQFVVITGISGSGKSTIAFDILYAEGMRRYTESLNMYARQFINQMKRPDIDQIEGLSPTICIEQKTTQSNPRSTVGTITEIYPLLKLLYFQCADFFCPLCHQILIDKSIHQIYEEIFRLPHPDIENSEDITVLILTHKKWIEKENIELEIEKIKELGYIRVKIGKEIITLYDIDIEKISFEKNKTPISIVIDRFPLSYISEEQILTSLENAYRLGESSLRIEWINQKTGELILKKTFSEKIYCTKCNFNFKKVEINHFSFNSPHGACPGCLGIGKKFSFNLDLIMPNKSLSIKQGAIKPINLNNSWYIMQFKSLSKHYNLDLIHTPIDQIDTHIIDEILYGTEKEFEFDYINRNKVSMKKTIQFEGIIPMMERKYRENKYKYPSFKEYMEEDFCYQCKGNRLKKEILAFKIANHSIMDLSSISLQEMYIFFQELRFSSPNREEIGNKIVKEILNRLKFLNNLGLSYLSLNRTAQTLSGGELQRIRLASQIGSKLMGILYILDEPSIGLHERDNEKLIDALKELKSLDNTLIVVEHDKRTILNSDYVLDIGPKAGIYGGEIVAQGTPEEIINNPNSLTGQYLSGQKKIFIPPREIEKNQEKRELIFKNCYLNNLKNIDIHIPLLQFVVLTGVSGSGKSTIMNNIIYDGLKNTSTKKKYIGFSEIQGDEFIDSVVLVDQSPLGKTNRSIPITYTNAFLEIRNFFSNLEEAKLGGYTPGQFSFNCKEGQCKKCKGNGTIQIQMIFLADVYIICELCKGKRYNSQTLAIKYRGKSIADILEMSFLEAFDFFKHIPSLQRKLKIFLDVGLDYLKLGQSSTTLSGGEAQRIKLAKELGTQRKNALYLLDEPTTGLHFNDIQNLLSILDQLVQNKNTVICIEHNLDLIRNSDYIIDLGPEGGNNGGEIIFSGKIQDIINIKKSYTGKYLKN